MVMVAHFCEYTKENHWIAYFKQVNSMAQYMNYTSKKAVI